MAFATLKQAPLDEPISANMNFVSLEFESGVASRILVLFVNSGSRKLRNELFS